MYINVLKWVSACEAVVMYKSLHWTAYTLLRLCLGVLSLEWSSFCLRVLLALQCTGMWCLRESEKLGRIFSNVWDDNVMQSIQSIKQHPCFKTYIAASLTAWWKFQKITNTAFYDKLKPLAPTCDVSNHPASFSLPKPHLLTRHYHNRLLDCPGVPNEVPTDCEYR